MIAIAASPFDVWASAHGYNTAPAVAPIPTRTYADRDTQATFDAWNAGAAHLARMLTESTFETEALRQKLLAIAVSE